ncbi:MAG: XTP/dITP diphosphatase [Deltaproteobacteria bacterium]|nr:XTP/dITP diphosphatase [Deltaproteobacteria bacterium]
MQEHKLIVATQNKNKIKEIADILADQPIEIMNLGDFGPTPIPDEDGDTFEDNAYIKASFYARVLGFPALADDSGLMVEALDGAPGVHSARWAGESATDAEKCALLLKQMEGRQVRRASFVCALVLAVPSGAALTWIGRCDGELTTEPRGFNGFGYDPIFLYPPLKRTFAELTRAEKGRVSHRGRALAEFKSEFRKVLTWLDQRMNEIRDPC